MNNKVWYEVFKVDGQDGETQTLQCCDTLEEARTLRASIIKEGRYTEVHIDKWEDTDNPRIISVGKGEVEEN